mmetsp:Transcript_7790/g.13562  ORF Transcript_7790/g.13562 Transcript_7790/m.13562 type:complete len:394 (+) Transcript_7790:169-1350(+)
MSSTLVPSHALHRQRRKYIALAVAAITIFVHIAHSSLGESGMTSSPSLSSQILISPRPSLHAEEIIQRSYRQTFGALSTEILCSLDIDGKTCINSLLAEAMEISSLTSQSNNNTTSMSSTKSFPWWFITMLRDIKKKGSIHGAWHNLTILDPPMDFCAIEKIATTQWRNVQCFLNEGIEPKTRPRPCHLNKTSLDSRRSENVSRVVMLRDPLERLLSGYLNKCAHDGRRRVEGHCEPNTVFNDTDLTLQIRQDPRQLFAAYVDGFPLTWNIHFSPQSMYCDVLFRHVDNYEFVGHMGKDFFGYLQDLAAKLGQRNKLPEALEKVFHLSRELTLHENSNVGTETKAATHVNKYFTAASVRRALEYFAVDYVRLGLEVPSWAHDILAEESEIFMK